MTVVVREAVFWPDALRPGARQRVGSDHCTGDFLHPVDTVSIAGDRVDARFAIEGDRERKQEFDIATTAAVAAHGDRRLPAGDEHAVRRERLAMRSDVQGDAGHDLADVARFPFDRVAEDLGRDAQAVGDRRRGFEGTLRRRDHPNFGPREPRVPRLDRFAFAGFEDPADVIRYVDRVAAEHIECRLARGRIVDRRSRCDVHRLVARHVRHEQGHDVSGMARGRESSTFDRRQVAANAIHFADRRSGFEQRAIHVLFVVERKAGRGQREQR